MGEIMTFDPNNVKVAAKFNNSNCPSLYTHRIVLLSTDIQSLGIVFGIYTST